MIKQVISEIKQQLQCANIIDCQINEYQLQKLYDGMIVEFNGEQIKVVR